MEIYTKSVFRGENGGVRVEVSTAIKFITEASTNGLVKGPAMTNLRESTIKMMDIIEKYEKGKKGRKRNTAEGKGEDN